MSLVSQPQGRTPFALGEAIFNERRMVDELIENYVAPRLKGRRFRTASEKLFYELFSRVRSWLMTLGRLDNANDFQAVNACNRAMFEMTVDLMLLRFASTSYPPQKMLAWEASAKYAHGKPIEAFYAKRKVTVPSKFRAQMQFIKENEKLIDAVRTKFGWLDLKKKKPYHPARWTGSGLRSDAAAAHLASPAELRLEIDLEQFYATKYAYLCWHVHGSGAAGVRFVPAPDIPTLGALPLHDCLDLIVRCAQLVLMAFGLYGADAKSAFDRCLNRRVLMTHTVLKHHDPSLGPRL